MQRANPSPIARAVDSHDGEASLRWLRASAQLDTMDPSLRSRMVGLTQTLHDDVAKAVAIHNFVKSLPFGCVADYTELTASRVLKLGYGDCFAKGILMVGMLRVAGIPARLRFVSLPVRFLRGLVDIDDDSIMHSMAEVLLDGQWRMTDSYVPDLALQFASRAQLGAERRSSGYGVHRAGAIFWDGRSDASAHYHATDAKSLPTEDWGVADDPLSFYQNPAHSALRRSFASRLKWRLGAPIVNKRVTVLRSQPLVA